MTVSKPVPLAAHHVLDGFDCGEPMLDDWLKHRARKNESRFSRTYVVCDDDRVVAYYCIAAGAVERQTAPGGVRRNSPDAIPVAVIGRLAVSKSHSGRGLGADLLADAVQRIAAAAQAIGIAAVMVQAKDDNARSFYLACAEFLEFLPDSRTLYLTIESLMSRPSRGRRSSG